MSVLIWIISQLTSYSALEWALFIAVTYSTARYLPWWCIPVGQLAVAFIIYWLDIDWITTEMNRPDWHGTPDMDIVFTIGVCIRIVLLNTTLLPIGFIGIWRRRRKQLSPSLAVA